MNHLCSLAEKLPRMRGLESGPPAHPHFCYHTAAPGRYSVAIGEAVGALAALGAAVLWAATNLILRRPVLQLGGSTAQAWRTSVALLIFTVVFFVARHPRDLQAIPPRTVLVLLASVFMSAVLGDILQFTAIRRLGIALAMPIAASSPFLTLIVAAAFLGE